MKLSGIFGKGSGKVGSSVFAVSGGEQIVREYNPKVSNPQTDAQVAQRAKLKLMSQIAAALAIIIAFAKNGLVSARNQFVSANIGKATFADGKATIEIPAITLTGSEAVFPDVDAHVTNGAANNVNLTGAPTSDVDAVLYACVEVNDDDKLEVVSQKLVAKDDTNATFAANLPDCLEGNYVFAYGIKFANASDRIRFENYIATYTGDVATLAIMSNMKMSGATFTKTVSTNVIA